MKKPVKMLTGCGHCLLLNAAAAGTALAAGWTSESGTWKYVNSNGSYAANEWKTSNGESYYLGSSGKMEQDGWKTIGDYKYCFDSDGRMRTGWYFEGNHDRGRQEILF